MQRDIFDAGSVREARENYFGGLDEGAVCAVCDRPGKRYRRVLNNAMAVWIILLVRLWRQEERYIQVREVERLKNLHRLGVTFAGGDNAKLVLWHLISEKWNDDDPTKRCAGFWIPTDLGVAFADGKESVRQLAVEYRTVLEGYEGGWVTIRDCLNQKFDYSKLMAGIA